MPPWWLTAGLGLAIPICLAGIGIMPLGSPWFELGWGLAWGGGGFPLVLVLLYVRWRLMTFSCHVPSGEIRRFSGKEISKMADEHPQLYEELFRLNPGLNDIAAKLM